MNSLRAVISEGNSAVPLRVDRITDSQASATAALYCTDIEGTEVRVAVREPPATGLSVETGAWYQFDEVARAESLGAELLVLPGDIERIETPEQQTQPPLAELDAPWLVQLGASDEHIAVTVQPRPTDTVDSIDVENPETFEIGAVCFTHCDGSGETTVYHREEPDTEDEHLLLEHVVEDFSEAAGATVVTLGSDRSSLEMLSQRLKTASTGDIIATGAEQVLTDCFHANAQRVAARAATDTVAEAARELGIDTSPTRLSDYDIGLTPADWRETWTLDSMPVSGISDPQMTDRDYAVLIEQYLGVEDESVDSTQLGDCLKAYASAELNLLCGLLTHGAMDHLGCSRLRDSTLGSGERSRP